MNCKYLCLSLPSPALFVNGDSKEEQSWPPLFASLRSFCRICPFRLTNGSTFCILNRHEVDRIFLFFLHRNIFCVVSA